MANFNELMANIEKAKKQLIEAAEKAMETTGNKIENKAKQNLLENGSYETGELYNSIESKTEISNSEIKTKIGTEVEYAAAVELGTSKSAPKPYLYPAALEVDVKNTVANEIKKNMGL